MSRKALFTTRLGSLRFAPAIPVIRGRAGVWALVAAVLVLAGALAAVLGARSVAGSDAQRARLAAHLTAADIASTLEQAIRHEEDLTASTSAFVADNPHATAAEFDRWVESMRAMQRYPELQNIGLVAFVEASQLPAFEARMARNPLRPRGPLSTAPAGPLQILPSGWRAHYCLAVAGLARDAASYLPAGLDYCELIKTMITARDSGLAGYAPLAGVGATTLGVETPVYRGGATPPTVSARRHAFLGWLGERLKPSVVLARALAGHANVALVFRYDSRYSHVRFTSGTASPGMRGTTVPLLVGREAGFDNAHEGWTVRSFSAEAASGVLGDRNALALLIGGGLLSALLGLLVLVLPEEPRALPSGAPRHAHRASQPCPRARPS
jgi:hypothetical protein